MPVGGIDTLEVIFNNKILGSFNLGDWLNDLSGAEIAAVSDYLRELLIKYKIETNVQESVSLNQFYDGLKSYISDMSAGKVLIKMD